MLYVIIKDEKQNYLTSMSLNVTLFSLNNIYLQLPIHKLYFEKLFSNKGLCDLFNKFLLKFSLITLLVIF